MIRLIVFDLDGVLVDARDLHYDAMNLALADIASDCVISREEHLSTYDGLPTRKKLALLTENKGLSTELYDDIWKAKQKKTVNLINSMTTDHRMAHTLSELKKSG